MARAKVFTGPEIVDLIDVLARCKSYVLAARMVGIPPEAARIDELLNKLKPLVAETMEYRGKTYAMNEKWNAWVEQGCELPGDRTVQP